MPKSASLKYERVNQKEVKITYRSNGKSTEVVARVLRPGSYNKCEASRSSDSKSRD
jgi:hypothetical protein